MRRFFLTLLLASAALAAQAQSVRWNYAIVSPAGAPALLGDGQIITRSLAADKAGNVVITGITGSGSTADFVTTKLNAATGGIAWQKTYAGGAGREDDSMAVALDASGNAIVTGFSFDSSGNLAIIAIKYAADTGAVVWQKSITGALFNAAYVVGVDGAGNAIVGAETNAGSNSNVRVLKLAAADGATLWDRTIDSGGDDYITDLAVDASGNVAISGAASNASGNDDMLVARLSGTDGTVIWQKVIDNGADDETYAVATDASGNVLVTGAVATSSTASKARTIKFAAATGAIAWQADDGGAGQDMGQAIAVDASGDVLVAIQERNAAGNYDFRTIKYAGATGAIAWSQAFDGGGDDYAYNLALDASGNALVTGSSTASGHLGWKIVGYGNANGALIFQAGYAGSSSSNEESYNIAAVPGGVAVGGAAYSGASLTGRVMQVLYSTPAAVTASTDRIDLSQDTRADFNADGKRDLVWRSAAGTHGLWLMNGMAFTPGAIASPAGATLRQVGDYDGNGKSDLLWRLATGGYRLDLMNGLGLASSTTLTPPSSGAEVVGRGDFNGDGKTDLLWRNPDGTYVAWLMNGGTVASSGVIAAPGASYHAALVADFNGDGKSDILWVGSDGSAQISLMNGLATTSTTSVLGAGTGWSPIATGDFNGDGKADIVWVNSAGSVGVWLMNGAAISSYATVLGANTGWSLTLVRDLDGDGKSDLVWSKADGSTGGWLMDGTTMRSYAAFTSAGSTWRIVDAGDYDGDGKTDLLWRDASGAYGVWIMNGLTRTSSAAVLGGGTGWEAAR